MLKVVQRLDSLSNKCFNCFLVLQYKQDNFQNYISNWIMIQMMLSVLLLWEKRPFKSANTGKRTKGDSVKSRRLFALHCTNDTCNPPVPDIFPQSLDQLILVWAQVFTMLGVLLFLLGITPHVFGKHNIFTMGISPPHALSKCDTSGCFLWRDPHLKSREILG